MVKYKFSAVFSCYVFSIHEILNGSAIVNVHFRQTFVVKIINITLIHCTILKIRLRLFYNFSNKYEVGNYRWTFSWEHEKNSWLGKIWGRYLSKDFLDRILVDCPFSMLKDKRLPQQMNLLHFRKKLPPIFNLKQKFSFLRTLWVDLKIRYAVAGSSRNSVYV